MSIPLLSSIQIITNNNDTICHSVLCNFLRNNFCHQSHCVSFHLFLNTSITESIGAVCESLLQLTCNSCICRLNKSPDVWTYKLAVYALAAPVFLVLRRSNPRPYLPMQSFELKTWGYVFWSNIIIVFYVSAVFIAVLCVQKMRMKLTEGRKCWISKPEKCASQPNEVQSCSTLRNGV